MSFLSATGDPSELETLAERIDHPWVQAHFFKAIGDQEKARQYARLAYDALLKVAPCAEEPAAWTGEIHHPDITYLMPIYLAEEFGLGQESVARAARSAVQVVLAEGFEEGIEIAKTISERCRLGLTPQYLAQAVLTRMLAENPVINKGNLTVWDERFKAYELGPADVKEAAKRAIAMRLEVEDTIPGIGKYRGVHCAGYLETTALIRDHYGLTNHDLLSITEKAFELYKSGSCGGLREFCEVFGLQRSEELITTDLKAFRDQLEAHEYRFARQILATLPQEKAGGGRSTILLRT